MLRRSISAITGIALVLGLFTSILWWLSLPLPGFEAAANVFALLAATAGIPAERWAVARERRLRAVRAIRAELAKNREILGDERFTVAASFSATRRLIYPRLAAAAVDTALISGAFATPADQSLPPALYEWRNAVEEFNRRLDITEIHMFTLTSIDPVLLRRFRQALHGEDGYVGRICDRIDVLERLLLLVERDVGYRRTESGP
jgi:hypothetical protein